MIAPKTNGDRAAKRAAVLRLLAERDASSLLLTGNAALSWYLDGARVHIEVSGAPVLRVLVSARVDEVHLGSNEAARMIAEELPDDVIVRQHPWHELPALEAELVEADLESELRDLRRRLTSAEASRLRALGRDAAAALTDTLRSAEPGMSGFRLAGALSDRVVASGADPVVVLVGGASRSSVRHPLPTEDAIGRRAMVVVCARRHGLVANATRWVRFGAPSAEEEDADARILEVEADIFAATTPGAELRAVLDTIRAAYPAHGFAREEWVEHHQGGSAGYATREALATPAADDRVVEGQAFAWNPTGPGVKVEDTVLVTAEGIEPLTVDSRWPTSAVRGILRPAVLEL